jgi:Ran GTPase-activating protein (RanGAP) involved in mRNA processing and transport
MLSAPSFEAVIEVFSSKKKCSLKNLDLSNNKMGDKLAIKLITTLLKSSIMLEILNLSRSNLGFKTGAVAMNLLVEPMIKESTRLRVMDLSYNTISLLLQNSINKLLTETDYSIQFSKGEGGEQLECTSNFQNNMTGMGGPTVDSHTNNYHFTL